jgi:hypothetical protein
MKILLLNPDGTVKHVYHSDFRVIDHYENSTIDIIENKRTNEPLYSCTYTGCDIGWEYGPAAETREVKVTYKGVILVDAWEGHPDTVLTGGEIEAPEYVKKEKRDLWQ